MRTGAEHRPRRGREHHRNTPTATQGGPVALLSASGVSRPSPPQTCSPAGTPRARNVGSSISAALAERIANLAPIAWWSAHRARIAAAQAEAVRLIETIGGEPAYYHARSQALAAIDAGNPEEATQWWRIRERIRRAIGHPGKTDDAWWRGSPQ
jgi:hypothetical protein